MTSRLRRKCCTKWSPAESVQGRRAGLMSAIPRTVPAPLIRAPGTRAARARSPVRRCLAKIQRRWLRARSKEELRWIASDDSGANG
jgi:hypothetical protein